MGDEHQDEAPVAEPIDEEAGGESREEAKPRRRGLLGWIFPSGRRVHWAILRLAIVIALLVIFRYHVLTWIAAGHNFVWKKVTASTANHPGDVDFLLRLRGPGVRMLIRIGEARVLSRVADPRLKPILEQIAASHSDPEARRCAREGLLRIQAAREVQEACADLRADDKQSRILAAQLLADRGGRRELPALRAALKAESDQAVKAHLQRAVEIIERLPAGQ